MKPNISEFLHLCCICIIWILTIINWVFWLQINDYLNLLVPTYGLIFDQKYLYWVLYVLNCSVFRIICTNYTVHVWRTLKCWRHSCLYSELMILSEGEQKFTVWNRYLSFLFSNYFSSLQRWIFSFYHSY